MADAKYPKLRTLYFRDVQGSILNALSCGDVMKLNAALFGKLQRVVLTLDDSEMKKANIDSALDFTFQTFAVTSSNKATLASLLHAGHFTFK